MEYNKKTLWLHPTLGCDPEFFIELDGKVDGSEKIIPETGIKTMDNVYSSCKGKSLIKRDGVQCELNPKAETCRAYLHNEIVSCFKTLKSSLKDHKVTSKQVIKMDKRILDNLSKEARRFGCAPSENAYTQKENKINVSPSRYLYRSAGGHIHVGRDEWRKSKCFSDLGILVKMFDIVVGCTGVLLDRDIWVKERRKVYGRAGDYRKTKYGFEYRTLSNFWLKDYIFMSLMFGLARQACEFVDWGWADEIFELVKDLDIETIINTNDINGAIEVFNIMEKVYELLPNCDHFALNIATVKPFRKFFTTVYKPTGEDNIVDYWSNRSEGHNFGFNKAMDCVRNGINIKER